MAPMTDEETRAGDGDRMLAQFEEHRTHLRAVAYRMLGSVADADDAVQEAWVRLSRAGTADVENLGGWLTTVVARICLNVLRARRTHGEQSLDAPAGRLPDPIVELDAPDPANQAVLADSVGLALLVVLDSLSPAERLAFVLHDLFAVPFEEIAPIVGRSPDATRQLASRGRRRVQGAAVPSAGRRDIRRERAVVDAFFAAARGGDFERLLAVLDPDAVLSADAGADRGGVVTVSGAAAIAGRATMFADPERVVRPATVNGAAGVVITWRGAVVTVMEFTVVGDRIVGISSLSDPERLARVAAAMDLGR